VTSAFENPDLVTRWLGEERHNDTRSLPELVRKNKNRLKITRIPLESFLLGTKVHRIINRIACF
jgi:hypothetical protein